VPILGGLWGMAIERDRALAKYIFNLITNQNVASYYNSLGNNPKGFDQHFLARFVSPYSFRNSTTHDSFFCKKYNSSPWPSQRASLLNCFAGCVNVMTIIFIYFLGYHFCCITVTIDAKNQILLRKIPFKFIFKF
jgi:hypothetical protein